MKIRLASVAIGSMCLACSSTSTNEGQSGGAAGAVTGGTGSGATGGVSGAGGTGGAGGAAGAGGTPTCDAGVLPCGAEVVAQGVTNPFGLVLDGSDVHFTSANAILKCPKTGCTSSPEVEADNQSAPHRLALRSPAQKLFWTSPTAGTVTSCSLPCANDPVTLTTAQLNPDLVAVSDNLVFFGLSKPELRSCSDTKACTVLTNPSEPIAGLAYVPGTQMIYWSLPGAAQVLGCSVQNCGAGQTTFPIGASVSLIVPSSDGKELFFAHNLGPSSLEKCAATGCAGAPVTVGKNVAWNPTSMAADESNVYLLQADGAVVRCAVTGCGDAPPALVAAFGSGGTIAVDDGHVYWTVPDQGYVLRAKK